MTNATDVNFESRKNMQAGTITLALLAILFLFFLLVGWTSPTALQPVPEEGMEVNLGSSDAGLGNDQPFEPGKPAPQEVKQEYTPPKPVETQKEDVKDPLSNDKDEDAPEIKKPKVVKPEATKVADKEEPKKVMPKKIVTETPPAPVVVKPKAVFKGVNGTGTGGNEADSYKKGGSEGIAGGKGDQGRPGGDPNSKNYTGGGHGNSGINNIRGLGNRKVRSLPSFTDDFNQNGKVVVQIKFDQNGNAIDASIVQMGTTGDSDQKAIALRKARQIKISPDPNANEEQLVTFDMNFKVTN